jgi:hypothetical protein
MVSNRQANWIMSALKWLEGLGLETTMDEQSENAIIRYILY